MCYMRTWEEALGKEARAVWDMGEADQLFRIPRPVVEGGWVFPLCCPITRATLEPRRAGCWSQLRG